MAVRTPNAFASYDAASTTPPPTATGRPCSDGSSRCSTEAKNESASACRMVASGTNTCSHPRRTSEADAGNSSGAHLQVVPGLRRDLPVGLRVLLLCVAEHADQVGERRQHGDRGERDLHAEHALLGPVHVVELEQQGRLVQDERDADAEREREVLVELVALGAD